MSGSATGPEPAVSAVPVERSGPPSGGPVTLGGAQVWLTTSQDANLAFHVGDDPARVRYYRDALARRIGVRPWFVSQVHGADVVVRTAPPGDGEPDGAGEADAIVLDARGHQGQAPAAAIMVADCSPVVLASRDGLLAAAVHVGRAGLLAGALEATIARLLTLDPALARPGALHALLGPGICGRCYEVGEEIATEVGAALPAARTTTRWGTAGVDVGAGIRAILAEDPRGTLRAVGASPGTIPLETGHARCTYEAQDLYSYRRATHEVSARRERDASAGTAREAGPARTGRFAAVVRVSGVTESGRGRHAAQTAPSATPTG